MGRGARQRGVDTRDLHFEQQHGHQVVAVAHRLQIIARVDDAAFEAQVAEIEAP